MENEADLLGQELQKFLVQLNFDLKQKGSKMTSTLDLNSFKNQFAQINNLVTPLIKQLEEQQSSLFDKNIDAMMELPMKKKPKNRRKKKNIDDELSFLD